MAAVVAVTMAASPVEATLAGVTLGGDEGGGEEEKVGNVADGGGDAGWWRRGLGARRVLGAPM